MVYKKNFLSKVIFRIDFNETDITNLQKFSNKINKDFPSFKIEEGEEGSIDLDLKTKKITRNQSNKFKSWLFTNRRNTKLLRIERNFLSLEYNKYKDKRELICDIENIVMNFIDTSGVKIITRMGLRYFNEINLKESDYLKWDKYINEALLGGLRFTVTHNKKMARGMNLLVFKEEDGNINFNYGVWNPDFPGEVNKKEFVLDYDYYSVFPFEIGEVDLIEKVKGFNQGIEKIFELSITTKFRNLLKK